MTPVSPGDGVRLAPHNCILVVTVEDPPANALGVNVRRELRAAIEAVRAETSKKPRPVASVDRSA
ncbi:hypothetical protein PQR70_40170 [Paraburkholderia madseniana]|uniref:hypothetical protein n=1 Tax=Paraburkholderia madseniana TaxID=2599607 RepID=UPI0038BC1765